MEPQTPKYDNGKTTHKKIMERNVWTPSMGHPLDGSCRAPFFDDLSEYDEHFWAWYSDFIKWKSVEPQMPKYDNGKTTHKNIMEGDVWRPSMGLPSDEGGSVPFVNDGSEYDEHYWGWYLDFIRGKRSDRYPAVFSMDSVSTAAMFYADHIRRAQIEKKMGYLGPVISAFDERNLSYPLGYTFNSEQNCWMRKPVPGFTEEIPPVGTTTSQIVCEDNDPRDIPDDVWPPQFFEQEPAVYRYIDQLNKKNTDQLNQNNTDQLNQKNINQLKQKSIDQLNQNNTDQLNQKNINQLKQKSIDQLNQKNTDQLNQKNIDQLNKKNIDQLNKKNIDQLNQKNIDQMNKKNIHQLKQRNIDQLIHDGVLRIFKEEENQSSCDLTEDFLIQKMIAKCRDAEIPMDSKEWFSSDMSRTSKDEEQMVMKEGQEIQVPSSSYSEEEIPREPSKISLIDSLTLLEGRRTPSRGYLMPIRRAETTPEGITVPSGIFRGLGSCKQNYVGVPTDTQRSGTSSLDQKSENAVVASNQKTSSFDHSGHGDEDKDNVGVPTDPKWSGTSGPNQKSEKVVVATNQKTSSFDHSGHGDEDKDYVGVPTDSKCSGTSGADQKPENVVVATDEKISSSDHSGNGSEDKTNVSPRKKQKWYRRIFSRSKSRAPHRRKQVS